MKNKLVKGLAIVLFGLVLGLNLIVNTNSEKSHSLNLKLANTNALADEESGVQYVCLTNTEHCIFILVNGVITQIHGILV